MRLATALGISLDHAKLHLARWLGAQSHGKSPGAATPPKPAPPAIPNAGSTPEDSIKGNDRDLCYRGPTINTLEDLLVHAQVDTAVWEVERWVSASTSRSAICYNLS